MKRSMFALMLLWFCQVTVLTAQERLSLPVGKDTEVVLPFAIKQYKNSAKERFTLQQVSENKIKVTAKSRGDGEFTVSGDNISKTFTVSVVSDIRDLLSGLRKDLAHIPEIDFSINQESIVIQGNISDYNNWQGLLKVLSVYPKDKIRNFAQFIPTTDTLKLLITNLTEAGYKIAASRENALKETGSLYLKLTENTLFVTGSVYSQKQKEEVLSILAAQPWLAGGDKKGKIGTHVKIEIPVAQIAVDVAFIAVSKPENFDISTNAQALTGTLGAGVNRLYDLVAHTTSVNSNVQFGGNLDSTLNFLKSNGITRTYKAGTITFTNATEAGQLKVGGTEYIRSHETVTPVDYGFILKVKGTLIDGETIMLDLDLQDSFMQTNTNKAENSVKTSRICKLGKTTLAGGYKNLKQSIEKSGFPFLRNVPVIKWFVTSEKEDAMDSQLAILVSPHMHTDQDATQEIVIDVNPDVKKLEEDAKKTNAEYEEDQKKYKGWKSFLNWFTW